MRSILPGKSLIWHALTIAAASMALSSCSGFIYDEEGDCKVSYRVKFKYDYNMKFADAFRPEVDEVTLYLIDGDGNIVWEKTETGTQLKEDDYAMTVDVEPGTYSMIAWCNSAEPTTFTAAHDGTREGLHAKFHTETADDDSRHITRPLDRLFHGFIADAEFPDVAEGEYIYTIPLTKDTNHFVITLQQLSGEPIDSDVVEFEITDDNTHLQWDNTPLPQNGATYHQWYKTTVDTQIGDGTTRADNNRFAGVIGELTTSRLMTDSRANLRVYRTDNGETIASIRLIDAVLLVMGYENSLRLTPQQYLDYKDEYNMTFFLDANHRWLDGMLQIESWRVVYRDIEIN